MSTLGNILIRGVNWLGDAIMALPAMDRLREAHPTARLTLLSHTKLTGLWEGTSHFDEVIPFEQGESPLSIGRRLRGGGFDVALILPNSPRSALECLHARIGRRVGFAGKWRRWLLTDVVAPPPGAVQMVKRPHPDIHRRIAAGEVSERFPANAHQVHLYLHLAKQLGASDELCKPKLQCVEPEYTGSEGPRVGFVCGAEHGPAKRWQVANFIETGCQLIEQYQARIVLVGGRGDMAATAEIASGLPPERTLDLAGKTSLAELATTLASCDVVLANDTGPMHVASAVGTPVVGIFGSTSPDLTAPGLPGEGTHQLLCTSAPCSPCYLKHCPVDLRCLNEITPAQAVEAVGRLLDQRTDDG